MPKNTYVDLSDFGCTGRAGDDVTSNIAAAFAAVTNPGIIFVPAGYHTYTVPPSTGKSILVTGVGANLSMFRPVGCNGIEVAAGTNGFAMEKVGITHAPRYTTTINPYTGVLIQGSTESRPQNITLRDVFIDGFSVGIDATWLWSSNFDNVGVGGGLIGFRANGRGVNNSIYGWSSFASNGVTGTRGIVLGDGVTSIEGWNISNILTYGNEIAIEGVGATFCSLTGSILDYNYGVGVKLRDNGVNFAGDWDISGNYIGMYSATAQAGIDLANTVNNSQDHGCRVRANEVYGYPVDTVCPIGIKAKGAQSKLHSISQNHVTGFTTYDIDANTGNNISIIDNKCLSAIATNIRGGQSGLVSLNVGVTV